jgi:hypothetical protein
MADKEMYDYLTTKTPDYTATTLSIRPSGELKFVGKKTQISHPMDDGGIEVISVNDAMFYDVFVDWSKLTSGDAGTVMDMYSDTNQANGLERSFYWAHPVDGHTYVAKFTSEFTGAYVPGWGTRQKLSGFSMRVFGRKADA